MEPLKNNFYYNKIIKRTPELNVETFLGACESLSSKNKFVDINELYKEYNRNVEQKIKFNTFKKSLFQIHTIYKYDQMVDIYKRKFINSLEQYTKTGSDYLTPKAELDTLLDNFNDNNIFTIDFNYTGAYESFMGYYIPCTYKDLINVTTLK